LDDTAQALQVFTLVYNPEDKQAELQAFLVSAAHLVH